MALFQNNVGCIDPWWYSLCRLGIEYWHVLHACNTKIRIYLNIYVVVHMLLGNLSAPDGDIPSLPEIPNDGLNLPSVPGSVTPGATPSTTNPTTPNDIDFDDLAARFEKLKKRK